MDLPSYSVSGLASELDGLKGSQVHAWLQRELEHNNKNLSVLRDDLQLRWLQGQTQFITSFLKSIDEAAESAFGARETARRHEELKSMRNKQF